MNMMLTRYFDTTTTTSAGLGPREVQVIAGTSDRARDGHVVEMAGMDMRAFLRNGTILFQHNPSLPVGIPNTAHVDGTGKLRLGITFAPNGDSARADEVCKLVKSGIIRNLSIGFTPIDAVPLDPKRPRAGLRITRSELNECSFVSVPADTGAVVTARDWNAADFNARPTDHARDIACRRRQLEMLRLAGVYHADHADFRRRQRQVEVMELAGRN